MIKEEIHNKIQTDMNKTKDISIFLMILNILIIIAVFTHVMIFRKEIKTIELSLIISCVHYFYNKINR